ncbi:MAG: hypothetical protein ACRDK1_03950 [Solirubrobacterales bacterium]
MSNRAAADHIYVVDRCAQCLVPVPGRAAYRSPDGETLCEECHFALWGLRQGKRPRRAQHLAAPQRRRERRSVWRPEPADELNLEQRVRRIFRIQRTAR